MIQNTKTKMSDNVSYVNYNQSDFSEAFFQQKEAVILSRAKTVKRTKTKSPHPSFS